MNKKKEVASILVDDIDGEILKRMPRWLRDLREAYAKRHPSSGCK